MEWSERLNSATDYIEDNLTSKIIAEIAADKALCSNFHFQRIFYVVIDVTVGENTYDADGLLWLLPSCHQVIPESSMSH